MNILILYNPFILVSCIAYYENCVNHFLKTLGDV